MLQSKGDATIPIVADLQTPPALIPSMVKLWRKAPSRHRVKRRQADDRMLWRLARDAYYKS